MSKSIVLFFVCFSLLNGQYRTPKQLSEELQSLAKRYAHVKVNAIAKTLRGNEILAVTLGPGDADSKKALLIIGSIEAPVLAGSEYALRFVQKTAEAYGKVDSITSLLKNTTVYVILQTNPDGSASFFSKPLNEHQTNASPYDDDRDGVTDEDGTEDLNNDGIISMMRIADPRGEWIVNTDDQRLMKKADPAKNERGMYRLYSEGIDNDRDEEWNEDPVGGTDLNRNFTYNYQFFGKNSGIHQVSEIESRAVADFVFDHPNIGVIFSFSSNDNLTTAWKNEPPKGESPVISSVAKEDEDYFGYISKKFTELTKLKEAPKPAKGEGAFSEWAYYHAGRWSFSVRPWWPGESAKVKDSSVAKDSLKKTTEPKKDEKERSDDPMLKLLKWYDAAGIKNIVVPWTPIDHPDFPKKTVEIGGVMPFRIHNPPADSLDRYSVPMVNFMTFLAAQLPSLELMNPKVEKLGKGVFRVTVDVVNNGFLPTNNALGVKTRWVRNVRIDIAGKDASVTSGKMKQVLDPIKGNGGSKTVSWVLIGKGNAVITAESPSAGNTEITVELK